MATNIGEVIHCLDQIIDQAYRNQSRLGYFPALYIEVTGNIRRASDEGVFAAPQRMERFAVLFANRYLEALERYQCGQQARRHFSRNPTGRPSRPRERKIGDDYCLRRPAPSCVRYGTALRAAP